MKKICILISVICLLIAGEGVAEPQPKSHILGTFNSWTAYMFEDSQGRVCYMSAQPKVSKGKYTYRDDVFLTITHRPKDKTYDVVSLTAGFTYRKGSKPNVRIDNKKLVHLMAVEDMAWAKDEKTDAQLVKDMIAGSNAYFNGTSRRGTKITDTFSLKGFSKAYRAINGACGR